MEKYRKYLIIIPTAATMAAVAAFSASAYKTDFTDSDPIIASSSSTSHLSNRDAIKEAMEVDVDLERFFG